MTKRTSGSTSGFGNYLDDVKKNIRDGLGTRPTSSSGLKVARVLFVYRQGENADQLKDWSYGSAENSQNIKVICEVDGITDYFSPVTEEDFNKSLSGQLNSQLVRQTSIYQYPLFVSRSRSLPEPKVGDFILVSFSDSNGINFGFYEDFYQDSNGRPTFSTTQTPAIAEASPSEPVYSSKRVLGPESSSQVGPMTIVGGTEAELFYEFKKTYNKQSFRYGGGLDVWYKKISVLPQSGKIAISYRIATWDAVMGGDFHTNPPYTGFDCTGQNGKIVSIARYLQTGTALQIAVNNKKKMSYIENGNFVDTPWKGYLSFSYSVEKMYSDVGHLDHLRADYGAAIVQNKWVRIGNYIVKKGHIKTLVDKIDNIGTVWCNGTSMGRTTILVCGVKSIKNTQWEGIDEGKVSYVSAEKMFSVRTNAFTIPLIPSTYKPRTWLGELII